MGEWLSQLFTSASSTATIRSQALRPMLYYSAICMAAGVALLVYAPALWVQIIGAILALHHIPITAYGAVYLLRNDPDRLGSEVFVTQQNLLKFAARAKGKSVSVVGEQMRLMADPTPPPTNKAIPGPISEDRP